MKAVVLAAGKGTRMLPLTADKPKHMIVVNDKPFVEHIIDSLKKAGVDEIAMVVSYKKEIIEEYLRKNHPNIKVIDQKEPKGTGHAVLATEEFVGNEDFIVVMGDNLYSPRDIRLVSSFAQNAIAAFEAGDPTKYGVLVLDGRRLTRIVEKPKDPPGKLVNSGLYKFTPEVFEHLKKLKPSPRGEYELTDAITALAQQRKVFAYVLLDYWMDFGRPEDVERVESFLLKSRKA